jgi:uncharacterized membrane protein
MKRKDWIALLLVLITVGFTAWVFPQLPEEMTIHWGVNGEPDGFASRGYAVSFAPALMIVLYLLMRLLPKIDPKKKNYVRFQSGLDVTMIATMVLMMAVQGMMLAYALGYDVPMGRVVPLLVGGLFVVLGNVMPRFKHNYFVGVRTPWTLANEQVWIKTHAVSGKIFFFGGLLLAATALLPAEYAATATFVVIIAIPVSTFAISYYFYKALK